MEELRVDRRRGEGRLSALTLADGSPVVRFETPGKVWRISPALAGWLTLHLPASGHGEMLDFMLGDPVEWRRILMLGRHLGMTDAPLIEGMTVEAWGLETIHAAADFTDGSCWASSRLILPTPLPETVTTAMRGRRLGDVVDNPYLPADAVIDHAGADGANGGRAAIRLKL